MIDLSHNNLVTVKKILNTQIPNHEVWAFGSRVTGKAKKYSDLDLVIISKTPLPPLTMALLKEDFSESDLPIKVDILDWATLGDKFKQIILQQYEVIR